MEGSFDKFLKLAAKGKGEQIRQILAKYPQLLNQASGGHNRTLLWEAVNSKRHELVEKGADVHIQDKRGETPLDYAQKYKRREVANFLEGLR